VVPSKVFRIPSYLTMLSIVMVGIVGGLVLYYRHPSEIWWIPKCPFYVLTGLKCPGCGQNLRAKRWR
jgi:hypothetical protein